MGGQRLQRMVWGIGGLVAVGAAVAVTTWIVQSQTNRKLALQYQKLMTADTLDGRTAPDFLLTDQQGQKVRLSDFRGKTVVLEFMDPRCTDICPIVSQEIIDANRDSSRVPTNVEFVAVNVNQYHESLQDMRSFTAAHGLNQLHNWHFVTGNTKQLQAVWAAYGISVVPNPSGDVQHSSYMYFINSAGQERYIANPDNAKATIGEWGQGIAYFATKIG